MKIKVTKETIDRILRDVSAVPTAPIGDHFSEEDMLAYALSTGDLERLDTHLASCPECARKMEQLLEAAEATLASVSFERPVGVVAEGPASTAMTPAELIQAFTEFLTDKLRLPRLATGVQFKGTGKPRLAESADRLFAACVVEEANGDLTVRFDARATELEGLSIVLEAGKWRQVVPLRKVASRETGAELLIRRQERLSLPAGGNVRVRLATKT